MEEIEEQLQELQSKIEWYDLFVDYIYHNHRNKYNDACEYADEQQLL